MTFPKSYNRLNNLCGWLCFAVAAVTYLLTIEPTASYWDCPEYIAVASKLEIGHPPGNPVFMLTARFFYTIFELFGAGPSMAAAAINSMSAILSAATILLLFWTITALTRKVVAPATRSDSTDVIGRRNTFLIMAAGVCGALAYTWSDTFWFSAVEAEVYAYSSFCTALVFWLILKWDNHADRPHADRYLLLIAYIMGLSVGVHLLNLLCIPAIALVIYYHGNRRRRWWGFWLSLLAGFITLGLILYGLVPGTLLMAGEVEVFFVNIVGLSFNQGVLIYVALFIALLIYATVEVYRQRSYWRICLSCLLALAASGIPFLAGWYAGLAIMAVLAAFIAWRRPVANIRILGLTVVSALLIFIGVCSYALLIIRATANPPMNQSAVDNIFDLRSYINREQYGSAPLFYGPMFAEKATLVTDSLGRKMAVIEADGSPRLEAADIKEYGEDGHLLRDVEMSYRKAVKQSPTEPDTYVLRRASITYHNDPQYNRILSRMFETSQVDVTNYKAWAAYDPSDISDAQKKHLLTLAEEDAQGNLLVHPDSVDAILSTLPGATKHRTAVLKGGKPEWSELTYIAPGQWTNVKYFFAYQFYQMYFRYLMWNFVGRQNDFNANGNGTRGNWLSGINLIDDFRTGPNDLMPMEYGRGNKARNVYYGLPLILALIGMWWQWRRRSDGTHTDSSEKADTARNIGRRQFWIVFFLFFMTGVAIVLYLNQAPGQPRERDYSFAGSFYAFSIWIGMGIPALAHMLRRWRRASVAIPAVVALAVPLQMVSQTWDDHDRSGRYVTRDFVYNTMMSLDPNAVIFCNGDNDTFPLWYIQEVEGCRPDVRIVTLAYLNLEWYINQLANPVYNAAPTPTSITLDDYAYGGTRYAWMSDNATPTDALAALAKLRAERASGVEQPWLPGRLALSYDTLAARARYGSQLLPGMRDSVPVADLFQRGNLPATSQIELDIIASSFAGGFKRPVYIAPSVAGHHHLNLSRWLHSSGMALEFTPYNEEAFTVNLEKAYNNITKRFRWGGLDRPGAENVYYDETCRQYCNYMRSALIDAVDKMLRLAPTHPIWYDRARQVLDLAYSKLPEKAIPYNPLTYHRMAEYYTDLWLAQGNPHDRKMAETILDSLLARNGHTLRYYYSLSGWQYKYSSDDIKAVPTYFLANIGLKDRLRTGRALDIDPELRPSVYRYLLQGRPVDNLIFRGKPLDSEVVDIIEEYRSGLDSKVLTTQLQSAAKPWNISVKRLLADRN